MRIRCNSILWLVAAIALSGAACGDDSSGGEGGGTGGSTGGNDDGGVSTGGTTGSEGPDLDQACLAGGSYEGFKGSDIKAMVGDGACSTDVQIARICAVNPSTEAGNSGKACFGNGQRDEDLRTCTVEGDDAFSAAGVRSVAPDLTDECLHCYADAVACSAERGCAGVCIQDPQGAGCIDCRTEKGCTPEFYTCAGLPSPEDL